jgi:acetoin utilization protein AcuB
MKQMPTIQKYMTPMPHSIGAKITIPEAQSMMREYRIRHLPVKDGGKLVGIITDRDVKLASAFADVAKLTVDEVMSQDPYTVSPDAPLDRIVSEMAEKKYGSAIIQQDNGKVVGIFTAVDALVALSETLNAFYKPAL